MNEILRKIIVGIAVLLVLILAATGIGWWLAGQVIATAVLMIVVAIPTLIIIKIIRKFAKAA